MPDTGIECISYIYNNERYILYENEKNKELSDVPSSWTAIKLLEDDDIIVEKVKTASNFIEIFNIIKQIIDN